MPDSFEKVTALTRVSANEHAFDLPDGWQQGRGAFGGLVLGAALAAIVLDEPDAARVPRSLTGEICGPALPVASRLTTRLLRRGKNQTNMAVTFTQGDGIVAHASAVLATERKPKSPPLIGIAPPDAGRYQDADVLDLSGGLGPTFSQHYELRPTSPLPFSGAADAVVLGWVRERVPLSKVTPAALVARLDSYWPAIFPIETAPRGIATVSFMAELLMDPDLIDPSIPLFYRAKSIAQAGGYFVELRELWHGTEPVAFNQQCFALLS